MKQVLICCLSLAVSDLQSQVAADVPASPDWQNMSPKDRFEALTFTPPAYRREALRLIVAEANQVAREMNLSESLPIVQTNLLAAYISPPRMAAASLRLGNITTSNYNYYISVGNKFSFLVRTHLEQMEDQIIAKYRWPIDKMDTNAAYQLATQFLATASIDVKVLNQNCDVHITACLPKGAQGKHFAPLYWINWTEKQPREHGGAAVELCLPTKTILQMRVNKSEYILRQPLVFTNLAELLSTANALPRTNSMAN